MTSSRSSRRFVVVVVVAVAVAVFAIGLGCCAVDLALWSMQPADAFNADALPKAPDYARPETWLARPDTDDEADVALPELPRATAPTVDVFYVHPTTSIAPKWTADAADPEVRQASIRGGTLIQASVFNGVGQVWVPTYRQASGAAFTSPSPDGDAAIAVAVSDVDRAFLAFLGAIGPERPFIIAGHSQGAFVCLQVLRRRVLHDDALRKRLVAAYLIGAPVFAADVTPMQACHGHDDVGCVVSYNARSDAHVRNAADFGAEIGVEKDRLSDDDVVVATDTHAGAVFFDAATPQLLPHLSRASAETDACCCATWVPCSSGTS